MPRKPRTLALQAAGRGVVIQIQGDGESAKRALEMVREEMERTRAAADGGSATFDRLSSSVHGGVPAMASASAALRALEGNFTNNIRAGERFLSMLPGVAPLLQSAFPVIGIAVLGTALVEMGKKAYDAYQNIVELKGALDQLGQVDLTVAKHLQSNADAIERSVEQQVEATSGHVAALKQRFQYEAGKPIDLSELFYDKNFSGLKDNIKAGYEGLYKSVAPGDATAKLQKIRSEITQLRSALASTDNAFAVTKNVGGYGPGALEEPKKYYEARIKAAQDVEQLLSSEVEKRNAAQAALNAEINKSDTTKEARAPKPRRDNSIEEAQTSLAEEQAKLQADALKNFDAQRMAELEAQHKLLLVSDQEFYQEKLNLQTEALDAEENALKSRQAELDQLYAKQKGDKTLHRDKDGNSAEQLRTQKQMLENQEKLNALEARRGEIQSQNTAEAALAQQQTELGNLRAAAELEKQRGQGIQAQIALMRQELDLEVKRMQAQSASPQAIADTQALARYKEQLLEVGEVERQIRDTEGSYQRQMQAVQDRQQKGIEGKRQAEQQLNALRQQEVAQLATLAQQYQALADTLGGPFVQKADELWAQLSKMSTPDQKQESQVGKTLSSGITSMADTIAEQTIRGKTSFHEMAKEMEADAAKLILKLIEMKALGDGTGASGTGGSGGGWLGQIFGKLFGGGGGAAGGGASAGAATAAPDAIDYADALGLPGFANGGSPTGPSIIGEEGPELFMPPVKGGTVTPNNVLTKLAENGGGGGAPTVNMKITNNSSQPVTAQAPQVNYDSEMRQFVIHTVLENTATGGELSHLNPNSQS